MTKTRLSTLRPGDVFRLTPTTPTLTVCAVLLLSPDGRTAGRVRIDAFEQSAPIVEHGLRRVVLVERGQVSA